MTDAAFDSRAAAGGGSYISSAFVPRLTPGYNGAPGRLHPAAPLTFGSAGAGGMYATARDLFSYARALNGLKIVNAHMQQQMVDRAFPIRPGAGYGYGRVIRGGNAGAGSIGVPRRHQRLSQ